MKKGVIAMNKKKFFISLFVFVALVFVVSAIQFDFGQKLYVDKDGKVGIGTTTPVHKFQVDSGTIAAKDGAVETGLFSSSAAGSGYVGTMTNHPFRIRSNGQDAIFIVQNGNVGIGTGASAPIGKFTVVSNTPFNSGDGFRIQSGTSNDRTLLFMSTDQNSEKSAIQAWRDGNNLGPRDLLINPNGGNVVIGSANSGLSVAGSLSVSGSKQFKITNPLDSSKYLVHGSLEGPENGVYYRGEAKLENGKVVIKLPEYFEALTSENDRTVQLTPKFSGDEKISILAASGVAKGKFTVRAVDSNNPSQAFYWEVTAVRKDIAPLQVVQNK